LQRADENTKLHPTRYLQARDLSILRTWRVALDRSSTSFSFIIQFVRFHLRGRHCSNGLRTVPW
jgi:hypothetical protein